MVNSPTDAVQKLQAIKNKLDIISPSFCLAKWNQVTIHLTNGTTHSCHHCPPHKIPLKELKDNVSALHNTKEKKEKRKMMLEGKRPEECNFCWRTEDLKNPDLFSDRVRKSSVSWNDNRIDTVPNMPWDVNVIPKSLELDFSNTCNFKCIYCSPAYSSTWVKEIREHGPVHAGNFINNSLKVLELQERLPIEDEDKNPYIKAFWEWFPEVMASGELRELRVTGGEPLLSKNTFKLIDYFIEHCQPEMIFSINTNLGVPKQYIDKLITYLNKITDTKAAKRVTVYTSGEGHGARGEYIRYGLNYNDWYNNVDRILTECPKVEIVFMSTYNILSVTSFKEFLVDSYKLLQKHTNNETRTQPLVISIPYLRQPEFLSVWSLTEDYLRHIEECVLYMSERIRQTQPDINKPNGYKVLKNGFTDLCIQEMKRVLEVTKSAIESNASKSIDTGNLRRAFHQFIDKNDSRRNTSFLTIFPEMAEFYYFCKNQYP
jgi:organic radical activating enzyme